MLLIGSAGYIVLTEGALSGSKSIVVLFSFGLALFAVGIIGVSMAVTGSPTLKILVCINLTYHSMFHCCCF